MTTRQEAIRAGLSKYDSDKTCLHGHSGGERYVVGGNCVACSHIKASAKVAAESAKKAKKLKQLDWLEGKPKPAEGRKANACRHIDPASPEGQQIAAGAIQRLDQATEKETSNKYRPVLPLVTGVR